MNEFNYFVVNIIDFRMKYNYMTMCTSGITFSNASDVLQSDIPNSMNMCEQYNNEVLNTCSSNLIPIILSVAVTCLLTIIIHVIIIVVFTVITKRKSKQKFMYYCNINNYYTFLYFSIQVNLRINCLGKIHSILYNELRIIIIIDEQKFFIFHLVLLNTVVIQR